MVTSEAWTENGIGRGWPRGLPVEVVVGIVLSVILALVIALVGGAMTAPPTPDARTITVPAIEDEPVDLDPRDPLVRCTVFDTHTHCIREQS
jgi:hypothetical protein